MPSPHDSYHLDTKERKTGKPLFVVILTAIVLIAFLTSLGFVYTQDKKAVLLLSIIFIGTFSMFILRDVKPYLLFGLAIATSLNIDFFFFQDLTTSYHATRGYFIHLIFFPVFVLWVLLLFGVLRGDKRFSFKKIGLVPLFVYVVMTILSIQQSPIPSFSHYELFSLTVCVLLYLVMTNSIERRSEVFAICVGIAVIISFQGALSIIQYIKGSPLGLSFLGEVEKLTVDRSLSENVRRASGTLGYPNTLALYLDLLLPTVAGMALITRHSLYRLFFIAATLLGFGASVLTVSRGGLAASVLGLSMVILFWGYRRRRLIPVVMIGLVIGAILFSVIVLTDDPIKSRLLQENDASANSRAPMLAVSERMIASNLFFGVGLNNYTNVAPRYDATSIRISIDFPYPVHNTPLLVLAEIGLIGFLAFSLFILSRMTKSASLAFDDNKDFSILGFSLGTGLMIFILHGMVDYTYLTSNYTFWFVCGLITGLYRLRKSQTAV